MDRDRKETIKHIAAGVFAVLLFVALTKTVAAEFAVLGEFAQNLLHLNENAFSSFIGSTATTLGWGLFRSGIYFTISSYLLLGKEEWLEKASSIAETVKSKVLEALGYWY